MSVRVFLGFLAATLATAVAASAEGVEATHRSFEWLRYASAAPAPDPSLLPPSSLDPARRSELAAAGHGWVETIDRWKIELTSDGGMEERRTSVRTLLSDEGVRQGGTLVFDVNAGLETVTIEQAYAQLPDGTVHPVDRSRIEVQNDPRSGVFSDAFFVSVPYPGLVRDASLVLIYAKRSRVEQWPLPWSRHYLAQSLVPREEFSLEVHWAEGIETPVWATDARNLGCASQPDRILRCSQSRVEPIHSDPDIRSWFDLLPHLVVSAPQSWTVLADRERALVEAALEYSPEISHLAQELAAGSLGSVEALQRIHRFVADEIRYVAFEHGHSAVVPRQAIETLRQRFGDCKDKVALFLALARLAGFEAHAVLVSSMRYDQRRLISPSAGYFDHMIACVRNQRIEQLCVDVTSPDTPTGELPIALHGAVSLDLRQGVSEPGTLPPPRVSWNIEVATQFDLGCDGAVWVQTRRAFIGAAAAQIRGLLRPMSNADQQRWAIESYREVIDNRVVPAIEIKGIESVTAPIEIYSKARIASVISLQAAKEYAESDAWLVHYASQLLSNNRYHPLDLIGVRVRSQTHFRLCDGFAMQFVGPKLELHSRFGNLLRSLNWSDRELWADSSLEFVRQRVGVAEIERFNKTLRAALQQTRIWFRYRPRPTASSAGGP